MSNRRALGELGERIAESFLRIKGYSVVGKNFRYAGREIDLIAEKGGFLVAVEVKLRRGGRFGAAVEAVDARKLSRIRVALEGLMQTFGKDLSPRIDLVVIDFDEGMNSMTIDHLEGVS